MTIVGDLKRSRCDQISESPVGGLVYVPGATSTLVFKLRVPTRREDISNGRSFPCSHNPTTSPNIPFDSE